jgi:single-strand DNA-binding protein
VPSFNRVLLMGNLTRDPELKFLPSQTPVTEFGLAMNRKFKTAAGEAKEEVCFVDCTAFAKTAELISQYFTKGKPIFLSGRLKYDSWEDRQGGGKRSKLTVVVEEFQFIDGKREEGGGDSGGQPAGRAAGGENFDPADLSFDEPAAARAPARSHRGPIDERAARVRADGGVRGR